MREHYINFGEIEKESTVFNWYKVGFVVVHKIELIGNVENLIALLQENIRMLKMNYFKNKLKRKNIFQLPLKIINN
jgi:hypothetical protein